MCVEREEEKKLDFSPLRSFMEKLHFIYGVATHSATRAACRIGSNIGERVESILAVMAFLPLVQSFLTCKISSSLSSF